MKGVIGLVPCEGEWRAGFEGPEIAGHAASGYRVARVIAWVLVSAPNGESELVPLCRNNPCDDKPTLATDDPRYLGVIEPGEDLHLWYCKQDILAGRTERGAYKARAMLTGPNGRGGIVR